MAVQPSVAGPPKLIVRRDLKAVRTTLKRIKHRVRVADLSQLDRRSPPRRLGCLDRRHYDRSPVEMPIFLMPAAFDGRDAEAVGVRETEILAMTRDVSLGGVGFVHDEPFEAQYAIVSFDVMDGCPVSLLLEVCWSNIERGDSYMSGGKFLGITCGPELY